MTEVLPVVKQLYEYSDIVFDDSMGRATSGRLHWSVSGVADEAEAVSEAAKAVPSKYSGMGLRTIEVEGRLGDGWKVASTYGYSSRRFDSANEKLPEERTSYSVSMTTASVKTSRRTMWRYANAGRTHMPNYGGAINVVDGEPQGTDIRIPVVTMTIVKCFLKKDFTTNLRNSILLHGAHVNSAEFRGFPAGTLLFVSADISEVDSGDRTIYQVEYKFEFSNNENAVEVEGWDGDDIVKGGWEYLWIDYRKKKNETSGLVVTTPAYAFTEKMYLQCDYEERLGLSARG